MLNKNKAEKLLPVSVALSRASCVFQILSAATASKAGAAITGRMAQQRQGRAPKFGREPVTRAGLMAMLVAIAAPAHAVVQLDQDAKVAAPTAGSDYSDSGLARSGANGYDAAQTFTAGLTGTLSQIALQTTRSSGIPTTFTFSVFSGNAATDGILLGSTTFNDAQSYSSWLAGGMFAIDLSGLGISVSAGNQYSYLLTSSHAVGSVVTTLQSVIGTANASGGLVTNDYTGGRNYRRTYFAGTTTGWDLNNFPVDRGFQTFVDVSITPTPEPGEWAMITSGLALVGSVARRRKRLG